jgi:site-specific recombinase XerD
MEKEFLEPQNKLLLSRVLERIDPEQYGYTQRKIIKNNPKNQPTIKEPLKITDKNRQLLNKYYKHLVNEGIAITRQRLVLGVLGRLLEMLGKDFETSTKEDIEDLVTTIRQRNISAVTQSDYLKKLKQFDKWFNGGDEPTLRTKKIKTGIGKKHYKLPSQLVTPDEAEKLINATDNIRDRALIHVLWESGARVGEVINCKMNSIQFEGGEAKIRLTGKVGERQVLLLESVRDLKEYVKTRQGAKPEEPLFILQGCNGGKGNPITHHAINKMLRKIKSKVALSKHVHAYLFRHSRASYLASQGLNEAQLCTIFGWIIGSKQPATYIHLSGSQTEDAYKRLYGIKKQEETEKQILMCQVCGEMNPSTNNTCSNCYNPLTIKGALKVKQENEELQKANSFMQELQSLAFNYIEKGFSVPEAKVKAMEEIVEKETKTRLEKMKALA